MPHVAKDVHSCSYCARIAISEDDGDGNKPWFFDTTHIAAPGLQESVETCPLFGVIPDISMDCEAVTGHTRSVTRGLRILVQDWVPWNLHIHSLPGSTLDRRPESAAELSTYHSTHIDSSVAFATAQTWIKECVETHKECPGRSSGPPPTRLLDVDPIGGQNSSIRLVETKDWPEQDFSEWAALSYSWGGPQPLRTTKDSILSHHKDITLVSLPRTLQDAVTVCRRIGVFYLWIDSLCIIQDDPGDLGHELGQMPRIYQSALVTICAASARSAQEGFLQRRPLYYDKFPPTKLRIHNPRHASEEKSHRILAEQPFSYDHYRSWRDEPLNERAWAFQERMLSPRKLVYLSRELVWQCRHGDRRMGNQLPQYWPQSLNAMDHDLPCIPGSEVPPWRFIVARYTKCSLTNPSDKLVAISSLADFYQKECNKTYLAGLWKEDLATSLCWSVSVSSIKTRPLEWRAPSWSWASVDGEVNMPRDDFDGKAQVLEAETTPLYLEAPLSGITSASLILSGKLEPATLQILVERQKDRLAINTKITGLRYADPFDVILDAYEESWCDMGSVELDVQLLLLVVHKTRFSYHGIVLQEKDVGCIEKKVHQRIGQFSSKFMHRSRWYDIFTPDSEFQTVQIE